MRHYGIPIQFSFIILIFGLCANWAEPCSAQDDKPFQLTGYVPPKCLVYTAWDFRDRYDGLQDNHALKMMKEPEIETFLNLLRGRLTASIPLMMRDSSRPEQIAAQTMVVAMSKNLFERSGSVCIEDILIDEANGTFRIHASMVFDLGEDAGKSLAAIKTLVKSQRIPFETVTVDGVEFMELAIPNAPLESAIYVGIRKEQLLICLDKDHLKTVLKNGTEKRPEWLANLMKRQSLKVRTTVGYVNVKTSMQKFLPMAGEDAAKLVNAWGFNCVATIEASTGYDASGTVNRTGIRFAGPPQGIFKLIEGKGISREQLRLLPADSVFAASASVDSTQFLKVFREIIQSIEERERQAFDESLDIFNESMDIDLEKDILKQLGPTWSVFNGSGDGWLTGMAMSIELQDAKPLRRVEQKIISQIDAALDDGNLDFYITRSRINGVRINSIRFFDLPLPFEPSWRIEDDRILFTLFPQTIVPITKPSTADKHLPADLFFGPKGSDRKLMAISYSDTKRQFEFLYPYAAMMKTMIPAMVGQERGYDDFSYELSQFIATMPIPSARSFHRHIQPSITVLEINDGGMEVISRQTIPSVNMAVASPITIALLLPAVQAARQAARRTQSANNIKQLLLAAHNHHDVFRRFPAGYSVDEDGKPLLSWRVHLLPFIEQNALYEQFHLDEPWDSEHNIKLLDKMPETLRSPVSAAGPGKTVYRGMGGVNGVFSAPAKKGDHMGKKFSSLLDGSSNTAMIVEASDELAIEWTKPEVLDGEKVDPDQLFGLYPGGTNFGLADGSVTFIAEFIPEKTLRLLFNCRDGESSDWYDYAN